MRHIQFRAKAKYLGKYVYGLITYAKEWDLWFIQDADGEMSAVFPETIAEFSGVLDRNGDMIFEGDTLLIEGLHPKGIKGVVEFREGAFGVSWTYCGRYHFFAFPSMCNVEYEVIDGDSEDEG